MSQFFEEIKKSTEAHYAKIVEVHRSAMAERRELIEKFNPSPEELDEMEQLLADTLQVMSAVYTKPLQ